MEMIDFDFEQYCIDNPELHFASCIYIPAIGLEITYFVN
jgi:hypothetical protein